MSDFFRAGHFQVLAFLDCGYKLLGLQLGFMRAGTEPGHAATHDLDFQLITFKIHTVDVANLQFVVHGRHDFCGDIGHLISVEIQALHGIIRFWIEQLFFCADGALLGLELDYIPLRPGDCTGKNGLVSGADRGEV